MAMGEWLSVNSSRELYQKQIATEAMELEEVPEEEKEELILIYQAKGLSEKEARALAEQLLANKDTALDTLVRVAAAFEEPFRTTVEVRNQARVHLWFENKFGEAYEALTCTDDAPAQFVAPAFALAVRLEKDDTISVAAPYGLDDVFDMVIRPNPVRGLAKGWDKVIASARGRWPEITVIDPA